MGGGVRSGSNFFFKDWDFLKSWTTLLSSRPRRNLSRRFSRFFAMPFLKHSSDKGWWTHAINMRKLPDSYDGLITLIFGFPKAGQASFRPTPRQLCRGYADWSGTENKTAFLPDQFLFSMAWSQRCPKRNPAIDPQNSEKQKDSSDKIQCWRPKGLHFVQVKVTNSPIHCVFRLLME